MIADCPPFAEPAEPTLLGRRCRATDLSQPISPEDPTFVGHRRTLVWRHLSHEETRRLALAKPTYS